MKAINKDLTMR